MTPERPVIAPLDLARRVDDALRVQGAAMALPETLLATRRDTVVRHAGYPGARALGAFDPDPAGALVGFAYGYLGRPGQWWHDSVLPWLERTGTEDWLADSFELAELHVLPGYQKQRIGTTLLTRLLTGVRAPRVVLSALDLDTPARRLYRRLGFAELVTGVLFPGYSTPYVIMGAPLPLPGA